MSNSIPLLIPDMPTADELLPWLRKVDENRWYTNYGPLNREFEQELQLLLDDSGVVGLTTVANCTVGLELVLSELALAPGSRVLVPAITFVATATAVCRVGLVPLLADVHPSRWLLTPEIARAARAKHPFDAVMPVSTFGCAQNVADWDAFTACTGVPVVIDAASAFGNQKPGQSSALVFSLHATKPLGIGEGGIVASRDVDLISRVRRAANFGIELASPVHNAFPGGTNAKLSEYHAAVGLAALPRWRRHIPIRRELYRLYQEELTGALGTSVILQDADEERLHSVLVIRLPGCRNIQAVVERLAAHGIGARRWYCPPLSHHTAFSDCPAVDELPHSQQLGQELIALPFYPELAREQVLQVVAGLRDALATHA